MARTHLRRKLETYQALACVNEHFDALSHHVHDLEQMGLFRAKKMRVFQGFIRELQSQISHDVVDQMHSIEDKDMYEYEKVRIEFENYLDPDKTPLQTPPVRKT